METAIKVKEISEAINYIHDEGIAHRDIKPENIVMTHVHFYLYRMFVNCVISDGLLFVMKEEKHIVERLTMLPLKYCREFNMI